ncbi:MAG: nucleoside monophosphate kinase, partial [Verrucomicrobia bacterium]|nr:nucleoside monophosphate kinase [Verrucomicrobiota bacterium]
LAEVEIKDAQIIFGAVWKDLQAEFGIENLRFPKEIILLGGAPGAGKGTNTAFIMKARGFTCPPIVVSELLDSPEARALKDNGMLVGDREVMGILLRKMLGEEFRDGAVLDGFPRSKVQVECMKLLVKKISFLHRKYAETALAAFFRQPTIHVMVLFVDEKTSVERRASTLSRSADRKVQRRSAVQRRGGVERVAFHGPGCRGCEAPLRCF